MTSIGILQILLFFALILAVTKPLGVFMTRVFDGERTFLHPVLRWLEVLTYKAIGVQEEVEQRWTQYTAALISFSIFGFLLVYFIQRAQGFLPLNPQGFNAGNISPDLAFNTSTSFITNTNWQSYSGESTLSYFVQMAALTVQNFASAAAGYCCGYCAGTRICAPGKEDYWKLLGGCHPSDSICPSAGIDCRRAAVCLDGGDSEPSSLYDHRYRGRRETGDCAGAGRITRGDQAVGHEWRRLLWCQFRASV